VNIIVEGKALDAVQVRILADVPSKYVQRPVKAGETGLRLVHPSYEWASVLAPETTSVVIFPDRARCIVGNEDLEEVVDL